MEEPERLQKNQLDKLFILTFVKKCKFCPKNVNLLLSVQHDQFGINGHDI